MLLREHKSRLSPLADHLLVRRRSSLLCSPISSLLYETDKCPLTPMSGQIAPDDSMSLTASDAEELACSGKEPETPPLTQSTQPSVDRQLICVLTKTVEDYGLAWLATEKPAHGLLHKWYLKGWHQQYSCHRPAPFLLAVHEELTRTWCVPYSARVNSSTSTTLTTVNGAEERGYSRLPPQEELLICALPRPWGWKPM